MHGFLIKCLDANMFAIWMSFFYVSLTNHYQTSTWMHFLLRFFDELLLQKYGIRVFAGMLTVALAHPDGQCVDLSFIYTHRM